jgi:phenylalanine ammonia-lyase
LIHHRWKKYTKIPGVNTGFGGTADVRNEETKQLQRVLVRELHYGILPPASRDPESCLTEESRQCRFDLQKEHLPESSQLPKTWTRAALLIRLNSLIKGFSGVREEIPQRLLDLLAKDIIPVVPLRGSISASGDLSPLSYLAGAIQGKSTIRIHANTAFPVYADEAFAKAGLKPVTLEAKEGLAIVNGTAVSAASASLALFDSHMLATLSQIVTAMSVEAMRGTVESFHEFFSESRPHPGQVSTHQPTFGPSWVSLH